MDKYFSHLSGFIIVTGLRHVKVLMRFTPFSVVVLYVGYLLNQLMHFLQTYIGGQAQELIRFW